jgi:hypothetical protein
MAPARSSGRTKTPSAKAAQARPPPTPRPTPCPPIARKRTASIAFETLDTVPLDPPDEEVDKDIIELSDKEHEEDHQEA